MARLKTVIMISALASIAAPAFAQDYPMAKTYSTVEEAIAASEAPATTSTYQGTTYENVTVVNGVQDFGTPISNIEIFDRPVAPMDSNVVTATNRVTYESPTATYTTTYAAPAATQSYNNAAYSYSVQLGDTLYSIAKRNGLKVSDLMNSNGLTSSALSAGQILSIPGGSSSATTTFVQAIPQTDTQFITASQPAAEAKIIRSVQPVPSFGGNTYRVLPGDTLYSIARNTCASVTGIANATGIAQDSILSPGQALTLPAGHCAQ